MRFSEDQFRAIWHTAAHDPAIGHQHFWERALSRRQFLGTAAAASGAAAAASLWVPGLAKAAAPGAGTPRPIPGTVAPLAPFHVKLPGAGAEPSTITDFNGFVAIADIEGTGTGTDNGLTFGADMRFMTGTFKGTDNRIHRGTFGFI
jgi:hypothetical protein